MSHPGRAEPPALSGEQPPAPAPRTDVLVLAGGTGRRLGGTSKPDVVARGARLIDHVLAGLEQLRGRVDLGRVVVVAPRTVALPGGVLRALEDPPLGGPVAGIAAGLTRLARAAGDDGTARPAPLTTVLACDAPESWRALPLLLAALRDNPGAGGVCARYHEHPQYLLGVYRRQDLVRQVCPGGSPLRDVSVRGVLGRLDPVQVDLGELERAARDLDTWQEVRAWEGTEAPDGAH